MLLLWPLASPELPPWVWLTWIPQLLMSLQREEAAFIKPILFRLAQMFPQGVYYPLRTFLLDRREAYSRTAQVRGQMHLARYNSRGHGAIRPLGPGPLGPRGSGDQKPGASGFS